MSDKEPVREALEAIDKAGKLNDKSNMGEVVECVKLLVRAILNLKKELRRSNA